MAVVAVVVFVVVTATADVDEDEAVDKFAVVSFVMSVKLRDFFESDSRLARRAAAWCEEGLSLVLCCLPLPPWPDVFAADLYPTDEELCLLLLSKMSRCRSASSVALL